MSERSYTEKTTLREMPPQKCERCGTQLKACFNHFYCPYCVIEEDRAKQRQKEEDEAKKVNPTQRRTGFYHSEK